MSDGAGHAEARSCFASAFAWRQELPGASGVAICVGATGDAPVGSPRRR